MDSKTIYKAGGFKEANIASCMGNVVLGTESVWLIKGLGYSLLIYFRVPTSFFYVGDSALLPHYEPKY